MIRIKILPESDKDIHVYYIAVSHMIVFHEILYCFKHPYTSFDIHNSSCIQNIIKTCL